MSFLIDFCLPALLISSAALLALSFLRESALRLRTILAVIGLLAWCVPWSLVTLPVPAPGALPLAQWIQTSVVALELEAGSVSSPVTEASSGMLFERWWLVLFLPGPLLFLHDLSRRNRRLSRLRQESRDGEHLRVLLPESLRHIAARIRIIPGANALATGGRRGTIWVGEALCAHRELEAALVHECCHLRRNDAALVLAINLVRRLYCWNPIVLALGRQFQLLIEQSCDAESAAVLGRTAYRRSLARLIVDSSASDVSLVPTVLGGSDDYRRIRALGAGSASVLRRLAATLLMFTACLLALSVNAHQRDPRIGEWRQDRTSDHYLGLHRIFEDLGHGLTRTHIAANLSLENQQFLDHRCDGSFYPVVSYLGMPTGVTIGCEITDANTVRSKAIRDANDSLATFGYWQGREESDVTETISRDGRRYTVVTERRDRNGRVIQAFEQTFARIAD